MADNTFKIIDRYRNSAPVDVESLVKELGIELAYANLEDEISGQIECADDRYRIVVNVNHAKTRQRFTIAHELGHYVYHRPAIGDGITEDRLYRSVNKGKYNNTAITPHDETEANSFAAYLLMPKHLIEQFRQEGLSDEEMAASFNVSLQAMRIKLGVM